MKVLQVNCVFREGSTGKIVNDIDISLKNKEIDSYICYGRGKFISEKGIYKFCTELEAKIHALFIRLGLVMPYGGNYFSTKRLINKIKKEEPDIVHLHCINGSCVNIYTLLKFLGQNKYKTLVTHHAEFFYTGSCGYSFDCNQFMTDKGCVKCPQLYDSTRSLTLDRTGEAWRKMKESFNYFEAKNLMFTSVSDWVKQRSSMSPIVRGVKCETVLNGVDTQVFNYKKRDKTLLSDLGTEAYSKIIVHVTASFIPYSDTVKGSKHIVELAKLMPNVLFLVVALSHGELSNLPQNIVFYGKTKTQNELADLYRLADVTILTSKRETFSMIVAESWCCGTPVVGFKAGGPETITINEYSDFVEYGNLMQLKVAVNKMLHSLHDKELISYNGILKYSKENMTESFLSVYKKLMEG